MSALSNKKFTLLQPNLQKKICIDHWILNIRRLGYPKYTLQKPYFQNKLPLLALLRVRRGGVFCVKIGKISTIFQPKARVPSNKNQNFQKFLTYFPKTIYERRATRNAYIFASKAQVALIIEGVFFYSLSLPEFIPGCTYTALLPGSRGRNSRKMEK